MKFSSSSINRGPDYFLTEQVSMSVERNTADAPRWRDDALGAGYGSAPSSWRRDGHS